MIAYLSGGMENAEDSGSQWRNKIKLWLKENLDHDVIDPVQIQKKTLTEYEIKNYRNWINNKPKKFNNIIHKIIDRDLSYIKNNADYIICLWDESVILGGGTHGELTMAYYFSKPVYLVLNLPTNKTSSWILGCSTKIFANFEKLKIHLLQQYESK
tara:strand:- start:1712 stop:2179 length:468 start_codon:yes stop_codon:yes gene_type:complete